MASRLVLYLTLLVLSAFVVMVTMAEATEEEAENTGLLREVERRSLSEILLEKRAVPDATQEGGRRGNGKKRGRKGRRKGKGKGKGKGRGRGKGAPKYASCVHHVSGIPCTCDMRYEHLKETEKQKMFYKIC